MNRRYFLHQLSFASLAITPATKSIETYMSLSKRVLINCAITNAAMIDQPKMSSSIVDLHCHPNLKNYLWGDRMWKHHPSKSGANGVNMQVDIQKLQKGNVKGFLAAHYLPERGMVEQAKTLRKLFPKLKSVAPTFVSKVEKGDGANFRQLLTMLDEFEAHVEITNTKFREEHEGKDIIKIARSYKEFEDNFSNEIISAIHAIEGSHSVGRDLTTDQYLAHIDRLYERGVCLITLAHFFQNEFAYPVEGIPPATKKALGISWKYHPEFDDKPLTENGKKVVEKMLDLGMVVDLTHLAPAARNDVFTINSNRKAAGKVLRPIMFSHTGAQELFKGPPEYADFKFMGVSEKELPKIKECRGVIGVVFMNYWLVGCDTHTIQCDEEKFKNGIDYIIETIKYIHDKLGSYEHIALGSDFDGFADSPSDLKDAGYFSVLVNELQSQLNLSQLELDMITHGNAMRVLKEGWVK